MKSNWGKGSKTQCNLTYSILLPRTPNSLHFLRFSTLKSKCQITRNQAVRLTEELHTQIFLIPHLRLVHNSFSAYCA